MTATLVKKLNDRQSVFKLEPPHGSADYVVSSISLPEMRVIQGADETYLFRSDSEGKILSFVDLPGSQKNCSNVDQPLLDLGYTIVDNGDQNA